MHRNSLPANYVEMLNCSKATLRAAALTTTGANLFRFLTPVQTGWYQIALDVIAWGSVPLLIIAMVLDWRMVSRLAVTAGSDYAIETQDTLAPAAIEPAGEA